MSIRVVHLKKYVPKDGEILVKIDRSSIFGNPFYMASESERDKVCESYRKYFNRQMEIKRDYYKAVQSLYKTAKTSDVALGCWCAPKRCHGDTIKEFLERYIK